MLKINLATHLDTVGYRVDRFRRDLCAVVDRAAVQAFVAAAILALFVAAVVLVPVTHRMSRLNVAASLLAVAACYVGLAVLALGADPATLALLLSAGCVAAVHLTQQFPSDHGWWMRDVQDVALEMIQKLEGKPPGSE